MNEGGCRNFAESSYLNEQGKHHHNVATFATPELEF